MNFTERDLFSCGTTKHNKPFAITIIASNGGHVFEEIYSDYPIRKGDKVTLEGKLYLVTDSEICFGTRQVGTTHSIVQSAKIKVKIAVIEN